jgi:hypothetical protein
VSPEGENAEIVFIFKKRKKEKKKGAAQCSIVAEQIAIVVAAAVAGGDQCTAERKEGRKEGKTPLFVLTHMCHHFLLSFGYCFVVVSVV